MATLEERTSVWAKRIAFVFGEDTKALPAGKIKKLKSMHEDLPQIPWASMPLLEGVSPEWRAMPGYSVEEALEYMKETGAKVSKVEVKPAPTTPAPAPVRVEAPTPTPAREETPSMECYVPVKDACFVELGDNYKAVKAIVASGKFYPVYIYGISGLGKTTMVEQACANCGREFYRCQITRESTDEDLLGSMHLVDGNTVWQDGPVLKAYRSGGVLLLDEIDLNPYLMILQGILEGKPFYVKQTGELVRPAPGFTIFATGNSKGLGESEYVGTMVLNEAQRDRFAMYLEQEIHPLSVEKRIAERFLKVEALDIPDGIKDAIFKWVGLCRDSYSQGSMSTFISTRRIHFLFKTIDLLGNPTEAVKATLSCYDDDTRDAMTMLWKSVYAEGPSSEEVPN